MFFGNRGKLGYHRKKEVNKRKKKLNNDIDFYPLFLSRLLLPRYDVESWNVEFLLRRNLEKDR